MDEIVDSKYLEDFDAETSEDDIIEISYANLDQDTQDAILTSLRTVLNVAEDDEYADAKILEELNKAPIVSIRGEDLRKQMNINI